jgi:hypothetical protein
VRGTASACWNESRCPARLPHLAHAASATTTAATAAVLKQRGSHARVLLLRKRLESDAAWRQIACTANRNATGREMKPASLQPRLDKTSAKRRHSSTSKQFEGAAQCAIFSHPTPALD